MLKANRIELSWQPELMINRLEEWCDVHMVSLVKDWRKTKSRLSRAQLKHKNKKLAREGGGASSYKGKGKGKGKGQSNRQPTTSAKSTPQVPSL